MPALGGTVYRYPQASAAGDGDSTQLGLLGRPRERITCDSVFRCGLAHSSMLSNLTTPARSHNKCIHCISGTLSSFPSVIPVF